MGKLSLFFNTDTGDDCGETYYNYGRSLYKNALAQNEDLAQELDENAEDINSSLIQSYAQKLMQSGNYDNRTSALKIMNSKHCYSNTYIDLLYGKYGKLYIFCGSLLVLKNDFGLRIL